MESNLADMVRQSENETFSPEGLDIPESEESTEETETNTNAIEIVSLSEWFDGNVENFPNLSRPNVSVQGVDLNEQLMIKILSTNSEGAEVGKLHIFNEAHLTPVLNIPAMDMQIYNNGFRIIYDLGNGVYIKSYGVRKGLISVFCNDVDDLLIPYAVARSKKRDSETIEIPESNITAIQEKLGNDLDYENLQLRYKQSSKAEGLQTNLDAIKWLVERQSSIEDINHHLQIDNVIIETLS